MGDGFNDLDLASALHDLDGPGDDWERQVARAYAVFGVDPLELAEDDPFILYGDPFEGADELALFNLPELDPDFLRAKAKEQLRDIKGRFREMRAKLGLGGKTKRADLDVDAFEERIGRPLTKVFGESWKRSTDGKVIIPDEFVREGTDPKYGPHSLASHMEDSFDEEGNPVKVLSKERERFYDLMYHKSVEGVPKPVGRKPRSWSLGGGAGSGKSTVTKSGVLPDFPKTREIGDYGKKPPGQAVLVEADGFKLETPEFDEYPVDKAASVTHVESTFITKAVLERAQEEGYDTVLDGMGNSRPEKLQGKAEKARSLGVETVDGVYVSVPTDEAMARVITRAFETGRIVAPDRVVAAHVSVSSIIEAIRDNPDIYDRFDLYDADVPFGEKPKQVIEAGKVLDQDSYQAILDKVTSELLPALEGALERLKQPGRYFGERKIEQPDGSEKVFWKSDEVRILAIQYATAAIRKEKERLAREAEAA